MAWEIDGSGGAPASSVFRLNRLITRPDGFRIFRPDGYSRYNSWEDWCTHAVQRNLGKGGGFATAEKRGVATCFVCV